VPRGSKEGENQRIVVGEGHERKGAKKARVYTTDYGGMGGSQDASKKEKRRAEEKIGTCWCVVCIFAYKISIASFASKST